MARARTRSSIRPVREGEGPDEGARRAKASARSPSRRRPAPAPDWTPRITQADDIPSVLERLPEQPGVYIMRDRKGEVIYVGKARRLRVRVRQYFNGHDTRTFVPLLAKVIGDIETVVTTNDKEALLLENNLIKEHRPRFNVKLRDDSNYLVLRLDPKANWPRLELVRQIKHDGAYYFGPYHSASSARATLRAVNRHFQLRTCTDYTLNHRSRPCLQFQINRCPAPCVYEVEKQTYADQVRDVSLFLGGRHKELVTGLRGRMEAAADELEFETAARLRDQLKAIETSLLSQRIVGTASADQDAIGLYREGGQVEFVMMHVRQGKLLNTQSISNKGLELPDREVLGNFVTTYYDQAPFIPDEVLLPGPIEDDDLAPLLEVLRERKGRKVSLLTPERGDRKKLVLLANRNAAANFASRRNRQADVEQTLSRLKTRLGLSKIPRIIECYDVSHIQGSDTVASMVVFVEGIAEKSRYRSFRIKGIKTTGDDNPSLSQGAFQNDDFASMYEVLGRRFRRAMGTRLGATGPNEGSLEESTPLASAQPEDDGWAIPDLVVIDGGKGQLSRVATALQDLGVPLGAEGIDLVALAKERKSAIGRGRTGLAKLKAKAKESPSAGATLPGQTYEDWAIRDDANPQGDPDAFEVRPERVFIPGVKEPIALRPGSSERYLMERLRDEAHRFAISHHRRRRGKRALKSALDDIEGVGPSLKRALVKHFGSIAAIRAAKPEALAEVRGVGRALAARIHAALA